MPRRQPTTLADLRDDIALLSNAITQVLHKLDRLLYRTRKRPPAKGAEKASE